MAPQTNKVAAFVAHARPNWPKPIKYIGGGSNGRIFETSNGRYLKIIMNNAPQEWKALQKLQGSYLFPRFKNGNYKALTVANTQKNALAKIMNMKPENMKSIMTMFIMGRVGNGEAITLHKYFGKFPDADVRKVQERVFGLIEAMHSKGVSHGDLHSENILVRADAMGRILGMWAIDFGRSRNIPLGTTESELYEKNKNYFNFWTPLASNRMANKTNRVIWEYDRYIKKYKDANMTKVNRFAAKLEGRLANENLNNSKIFLLVTDRGIITGVKVVRGAQVRVTQEGKHMFRRANVNMAKHHYAKNFIRPRENIIKNRRLWVANVMKNYKSPRKATTPTRRTKSASPPRRASPTVKRKRNNSNNADRRGRSKHGRF
jgi:tRNA A-37 threonylcarbamoyl transferase component Bud32